MDETTKPICALMMIMGMIAGAVAWAAERPDAAVWSFRIGGPMIALVAVGLILKLPSRTDSQADYLVGSAPSEGVFADATRVVAAGHNVLVCFATRNYAAGAPSESTARLCVYMTYYTTKRLQAALAMSIERHVDAFGEVAPGEPVGHPEAQDAAVVAYANFVRLTGCPEELIIDFGLNRQPTGPPSSPIPASYTATMDFHSASTFLRQVTMLVSEYESKNGPIETDIQKRVIN